jgi:hypothetical protein
MSTITGTLKTINEIQVISEKFSKRTAVIETAGDYPQPIEVEFINDKTDLLNNFFGGEQVEAKYNLRGREWVDKNGQARYFNTIQIWDIKAV